MRQPKLLYGCAVNDSTRQISWQEQGKRKICPVFTLWRNMLRRCYDPRSWVKHPTYEAVEVAEEWLRFSSFESWVKMQNWDEKSQLDKDLLGDGLLYGPDTCCFIPRELNSALQPARGVYMLGVSYQEQSTSRPYIARVQNGPRRIFLGNFETEDAAHRAWQTAKAGILIDRAGLSSDDRVREKVLAIAAKLLHDRDHKVETKIF